MPEGRTYTKWKGALREEFVKIHEGNDTSWDYVESFSQKITELLQDRSFDKDAKNAMLHRFYNPIVGLRWATEKMDDWDKVVTTVKGVCIRPDGGLFYCPEGATTGKRLLGIRQDSALLLLSILFLHEGAYKSVVNFIYSLTGHGQYKDHCTTQQAKCLAEAGLDIRVSDKDLRNNIAHMTFSITDGGNVVSVNPSASLPDFGEKECGRGGLISYYNGLRERLSDLLAGTQHWFNCNHGPPRFFDDAFFETAEGNKIRKAANAEMAKKPSVDHWDRVVERSREKLRRDVAGRA